MEGDDRKAPLFDPIGSDGGMGREYDDGMGAGAPPLPGEAPPPPSAQKSSSSLTRQTSGGLARGTSASGLARGISARFLEGFGAIDRTFMCPICFENQRTATEAFAIEGCVDETHLVCRNCAKAYVSTFLRSGGRVDTLTCPGGDDCEILMSRDDVARLDYKILSDFDKFSAKQSEHGAADCPSCQSTNPRVPDDPSDPIITCSNCANRYCFFHSAAHPPDEPCHVYNRRVAKEEEKARKAMYKVAVPCPKCGVMISRTSGCQHMTHKGCCDFCMLCLEVFPHDKSEEHYALLNPRGCPGLQFSTLPPGSRVKDAAAKQRAENCTTCLEWFRWICCPITMIAFPILGIAMMFLGMGSMFLVMILAMVLMPFAVCASCCMEDDVDPFDCLLEGLMGIPFFFIFGGMSLIQFAASGPRSFSE